MKFPFDMSNLEKSSYTIGFVDGLEEKLQPLYEWLMDENREPAQTKFTAGKLRDIAKEFEFRLNERYKNGKAVQ